MPFDDTALLSRTVAQRGVGDEGGTRLVDQLIDNPATAIDPRVADFIQYRVLNAVFTRGPVDPNSSIEAANNAMPDWVGPIQISGGSITCQWVTDSNSPSGHNLRFTINPGLAADEAYVEQIIPATGTRWAVGDIVSGTLTTVTALSGATVKIELQYLAADLSTTGSAFGSALTLAGAGLLTQPQTNAAANTSNAAFLRIRLTIARATGSTSGSGQFDFTEIRHYPGSVLAAIDTNGRIGLVVNSAGSMYLIPDYIGAPTSRVAISPTGGITASGVQIWTGIINPTIGATQNNWAPTGLATCSAIDVVVSAAAVHVTGFDATGFATGQTFRINPTTNDLILDHSSASSTSGNRINCPGGAAFTIRAGGGVWMVYDTTTTAVTPFRVIAP